MTLFFCLCLLEVNVQNTEAYSEPCQTSKMELFVKMIYCRPIQTTEERKWMTYIIFINFTICVIPHINGFETINWKVQTRYMLLIKRIFRHYTSSVYHEYCTKFTTKLMLTRKTICVSF